MSEIRVADQVGSQGQGGASTSELLTLDEAAARARLSKRTLHRALRSGRLRVSQPSGRGGKLLIAVGDLDRWLFPDRAETTPAPSIRLRRRIAEPLGTPARISIADLREAARP